MPRLSQDDDYDLLDKVQAFCFSQQLEEDFATFTEKNIGPFLMALREVGVQHASSMEHRLEFTETYRKFLDHFEAKIQSHIEAVGGDDAEFQRQCRRALMDLPQGSERRFFIEALLATTEYQRFFVLMVNEACRMESESAAHK